MYMTQGLRRAAKLTPNEIAVISEKRSFTWVELQDRVARLAGALHKLGLKPEDRIAMLSLNSDRYVEFYYGTFWAAGNVVPMNIRWSVPENIYSIKDSQARFLVVDDMFAAAGAEIAEACASIEFVIHAGDGPTPEGMLSYEALVAEAAPAADAVRYGEDLAGIFYTGGTTGFPKGVMLPHRALWTSAMCFGAGVTMTADDRTVHAAPLFHIAGSAMLFSITTFGGSHAIIPGFEPKVFLKAVQDFDPTLSLLVPTMIGMLLQDPELEKTDTSNLQRLIYGASPITLAILKEAMEKMPETKFIHAYGQTELAPLVTLLGSDYHVLDGPKAEKIRSVGRPVVAVEVEIVDEAGNEVPRGTVGEVRVRGATAMLGYWNKPEQTAATLKDGWVHTGDGGTMDEDGFITIVDRVKDMIITGGENVYSAEVENAVMQYPGLAECAVIGIPDAKWGEAVHAIVVPREGESPEPDAVIEHCRTLIAHFKCPHSVTVRPEPLPKSGAGKIQKFELRAPFWKGRDRQVG
ncbi:MAG TPA: long-chain-fatty-acid--CoA ligase [Alphaproteobacteria bacterium]|nr:long-chain-fatty-acid--CoA ligase [Alphaproteobacteria bacterium]